MSRPPAGYQALPLSGSPATPGAASTPPSTTTSSSPQAPRRPPQGHHRSASSATLLASNHVSFVDDGDEFAFSDPPSQPEPLQHQQGLGISSVTTESAANVIPRRAVGSTSRGPRSTDNSSSPSLGSGTTARDSSPLLFRTPDPLIDQQNPAGSRVSPSKGTFSETELDNLKPVSLGRENYARGPGFRCRTRQIHQKRSSWLSISILILSIYSTAFSAIYLMLAFLKPRYGKMILAHGSLTPSTASTLSALFAKTIELSFVTVIVAFLGQALSRNSFKPGRGMTIAEMSMRSWIMQPGTLITHWEAVKYSGLTVLGAVALTAALIATFYTTAADALVSPKLKFGKVEHRILSGQVISSYANVNYLKQKCPTPVPMFLEDTQDDQQSTCVALQNSGTAYHNYEQWQASWATIQQAGNMSSTSLQDRPPPLATLFDNTTVTGSWIERINMTEVSQKYNRTVNNVTMAMPHANLFAAVRNPLNDILQPEDLMGLGEYFVVGSVPSPSVNVLCASLSAEELEPIVYTSWNNGTNKLNVTTWPQDHNLPDDEHCNATLGPDLDELFGFGRDPKKPWLFTPPMFGKLPMKYNTLANFTSDVRKPAVYLLGSSPVADPPYFLCSMRSALSPNCSTHYHASLIGGSLSSHCEDESDLLSYNTSHPEAPHGFLEPDWRDVAQLWLPTLSLGTGISDGQAVTSRVITQFFPISTGLDKDNRTLVTLDPSLPSTAEALAVLAGSTLLMSSTDAPFIHSWNYSIEMGNILKVPQIQTFKATLRTQDYSSGGAQRWQSLFYIVLVLVFATNVFCLCYLLKKGVQITDYTEPQNLFSLAVNSPPSRLMVGACGAGPTREQFKFRWNIEMAEGEHFQMKCLDESFRSAIPELEEAIRYRSRNGGEWEALESDVSVLYRKLVQAKKSVL